jgi:hypothetical protein
VSAWHSSPWTVEQVAWFRENYSRLGKLACAMALGISEAGIRSKASKLHLRLDRTSESEFFAEFQRRAASSKVGRKRPAQAVVMRTLHITGQLRCTPTQRINQGLAQKERIRRDGHTRGALGMKHSDRVKKLLSESARLRWADPDYILNSPESRQKMSDRMTQWVAENQTSENTYSRCQRGRRADLGDIFFRSKWEANYARYLNWMKSRGEIDSWKYESRTFWFEEIRRGVRSYMPDFEVIDKPGAEPRYVEVKGWMDPKSATKIKRMAKYYPDVKLEVFDERAYRSLQQLGRVIAGWE